MHMNTNIGRGIAQQATCKAKRITIRLLLIDFDYVSSHRHSIIVCMLYNQYVGQRLFLA